MDVVLLSRWQFAIATLFHFLFVPLTLGLSILLAIMEWRYVKTGEEVYRRMTRFWGRIFILNFALGVVTGITLEFQFGTNWSRYSEYVGDIFGSLLAIEATVAFFLESSFLALWIFGWNRVSKKLHVWSITLVAIASNVSAFWILAANAWMQHPVGYVIRGGRAELADFGAVVTQKLVFLEFFHTVSGAFTLGGFFLMGVSAYHLLRKQHLEVFNKSFRMGAVFALIFSLITIFQGHLSGNAAAENQPAKLAAMESFWESATGAPLYLILIPDAANERNAVEFIRIPGGLSILAFNDPGAKVKGLKEFPPEERPPVLLTFTAFRVMVGLGTLFPILAFLGWLWRRKLTDKRLYLKIMMYAIPLPYIALAMGWIVTEVGRQPWIVYGLMKTKDAASPVYGGNVLLTLIGFIVLYGVLGTVCFVLMIKIARKGPEPAQVKGVSD